MKIAVVLSTLLVLLLIGRTDADQDELRKEIESASLGIGLGVNDSGVRFLRSRDFDALAKRGPAILADLVGIMRDSESRFDTFVRCWHVSNQIVQTANPERRILWYGSVSFNGDEFEPSGQLDLHLFKREVTDDIIKAAAEEFGLRINKATKPDQP